MDAIPFPRRHRAEPAAPVRNDPIAIDECNGRRKLADNLKPGAAASREAADTDRSIGAYPAPGTQLVTFPASVLVAHDSAPGMLPCTGCGRPSYRHPCDECCREHVRPINSARRPRAVDPDRDLPSARITPPDLINDRLTATVSAGADRMIRDVVRKIHEGLCVEWSQQTIDDITRDLALAVSSIATIEANRAAERVLTAVHQLGDTVTVLVEAIENDRSEA